MCLDISIVALMEARERIGKHGLFVVGDIAHLPFANDAVDDIVTLHTIHHVKDRGYVERPARVGVLEQTCMATGLFNTIIALSVTGVAA